MNLRHTIILISFALLTVLVFLVTVSYINKDKIWSASGQSAFQFAKVKWAEGQRQTAVELWLYGVRRTVKDSITRERAHSLVKKSDRFLKEGKSTEALNTCREAEKLYNEEGETTDHCLLIEQQVLGTATPMP
jgi:hypothetical protein